jgi:hypothetical protein
MECKTTRADDLQTGVAGPRVRAKGIVLVSLDHICGGALPVTPTESDPLTRQEPFFCLEAELGRRFALELDSNP